MVTGSSGFIGSHLVEFLARQEDIARVVCVDSEVWGPAFDVSTLPGKEKIVKVNASLLLGSKFVSDLHYRFNVKEVYHLAAMTSVDQSLNSAVACYSANVLGTLAVLDSARERGFKVIHVSTDEVYGSLPRGSDSKFTLDSPFNPSSPYSASKAAADDAVRVYAKTWGLHTVTVRPCNAYGPRQDNSKFIPTILRAFETGKPIHVYGDGKQVREWLYVKDFVRGIYYLGLAGDSGAAYHLGSGEYVENLQLIQTIRDAVGHDITPPPVEHVEGRPCHDDRYSLDLTETVALGFEPVYSFHAGLKETVDHWKQHFTHERGSYGREV